ncbi:MAG: hypothetical protein EOP48_31445 [Sphingobacteriales bacterium]|nr:MAG: hypothetical protein EOP48_31445 [Sphingobacteriales bacterium]
MEDNRFEREREGGQRDVCECRVGYRQGAQYDLEASGAYFKNGYNTLKKLVVNTADKEWLEEIDTTWFGKISRIKLFSILLFHNSHHCGQISSTILKGKK